MRGEHLSFLNPSPGTTPHCVSSATSRQIPKHFLIHSEKFGFGVEQRASVSNTGAFLMGLSVAPLVLRKQSSKAWSTGFEIKKVGKSGRSLRTPSTALFLFWNIEKDFLRVCLQRASTREPKCWQLHQPEKIWSRERRYLAWFLQGNFYHLKEF